MGVRAPTGTVTFLFTDVEGSTALWQQQRSEMPHALARHDAILERAISANQGYVFATGGDGFSAAFQSASAAAAAAVEAQQGLTEEEWPPECALRVRMGLHTGEAVERGGNYFGPPVNLCARLMGVAHGGQIVCSSFVGALLDGTVGLLDLGEHRLRDVESVVRVSQIVTPGLARSFPPLRSTGVYRTNLGFELSSFVGHEDDLQALVEAVRDSRVVSIVGSGGMGKTRTALRVGAEVLPTFADGVWLCELASVAASDGITETVASALRVAPSAGFSLSDALLTSIEPKQLLLILDNCEHLIDDVAAFVASVCRRAPAVRVLATSREALALPGERVFPLRSLSLSEAETVAGVLGSEAGTLFAARARDARPHFALTADNAAEVARLCRRLDGVPLALELAAARMAALSLQDIVTHLDGRFRLLDATNRNTVARHQTLRAAIDWSYELLDEDERRLLECCSVFTGEFDAAAVAAVATGNDEARAIDLFASLASKSLAERATEVGATRYRLLESIRQYASERLDARSDAAGVHELHARHYFDVASEQLALMRTPADMEAIERLELEIANIVSAADWMLDQGRACEFVPVAEQLLATVFYCMTVTSAREFARLAMAAIEQPNLFTPEGFRNATAFAAMDAFAAGDGPRLERVVALASARPDAPQAWHTARSIQYSALADMDGAASESRASLALYGEDPDDLALSGTLLLLGMSEAPADPDAARRHAEAAVAAARAGGDASLLCPLFTLALVCAPTDPLAALAAAEECIRLDRTSRRVWSTNAAAVAAQIHAAEGNTALALREWRDVIAHHDRTGERMQAALQVGLMANLIADNEPALAVELGLIAESGSIAPSHAFDSAYAPQLARALELTPSEDVARKRAAAEARSYRDSIDFVLAAVDRLIS